MNESQVHDWAAARGMAVGIVDIGGLELVRTRLERLAGEGALEAEFVRKSLSGFRYLEGRSVQTPRSLVLLAMPRPAHIITFSLAQGERDFLLPPTYVDYTPTFDLVRGWFRKELGLARDQVDLVSAPLKSLAAAAGLIRYGRNNVGYVPGMGSYVQLFGLATSFDFVPDGDLCSIEDQGLDLCRTCRACLKACPTGAIGEDRYLLRAERCYTLFSESIEPIPANLYPPSPDCLIGCLKCQEVCPVNKGLLKRERTGISFDRGETEVLLGDTEEREADAWADARKKLASLGMSEDTRVFIRNLRLRET